MKDYRCMICKYQGDHSEKELSKDRIFRERGGPIIINLCYNHSWDLFRNGQKKFLEQYRSDFMAVFGTENESELIEHLKGTGKGFQSWAA